jgi:uncharacterized membrane protein
MSLATVLKLARMGSYRTVALQVIFYFVFQIIGYDSYLLSITLIISVVAVFLFLVGWRILKNSMR